MRSRECHDGNIGLGILMDGITVLVHYRIYLFLAGVDYMGEFLWDIYEGMKRLLSWLGRSGWSSYLVCLSHAPATFAPF